MKYCTKYRSKLFMRSLEYHFVVSLSRCIITQIVDTKTKFSWPIRHLNQFMLCSVCCMLPVRALHWLYPRSNLYWRSLILCAIRHWPLRQISQYHTSLAILLPVNLWIWTPYNVLFPICMRSCIYALNQMVLRHVKTTSFWGDVLLSYKVLNCNLYVRYENLNTHLYVLTYMHVCVCM